MAIIEWWVGYTIHPFGFEGRFLTQADSREKAWWSPPSTMISPSTDGDDEVLMGSTGGCLDADGFH